MSKCRHKESIHDLKLQVDTLAFLKDQGLKLTEPRRAMIHLMAHESGPFTIEDLQRRVAACEGLAIDPATVYRNMLSLEQIGVVMRCDFGDGIARFELRRPHHHHRIICRVCRESRSLGTCAIDDKVILPEGHGFRDITHRLEFFGTCPRCCKRVANH